MSFLLSQAADPINGAAGWAGAGLLGAVLGWLLLKYLPGKDAQLEKLIDDHSKRIDAIHQNCKEERADIVEKFEINLTRVLTHQDTWNRDFLAEFKELADRFNGKT